MPGPVGPSPRLLGRIAAVLLAAAFVAVIWWAMSRGGASSHGPSTPGSGIDPADIPDITQIDQGESIVLTLVDKDDPTRVAGVIEADRFDPVGDGQRLLHNPRAWLYTKDARAIRVRADTARLEMSAPDQAPESGTLEGSVSVKVYEHPTGGSTPPPDDALPAVTATFEHPLRFERRYLRLSSDGPFVVDSDQIRFEGISLTVMLNEVRDRLELIDVGAGGRMELRLGQLRAEQPTPTPPTPAQSDPTPIADAGTAVPTTPPPAPKVDLYETILHQTVVATLGNTTVQADRLNLFTRLTDNTIPAASIARIGFARTEQPSAAAPATPTTAPAPPTDTPQPPAVPAPDDNTLVLTWAGPMTIRPIDTDAPPQLAADDATLTLHADEGKQVAVRDPARGLAADAGTLTYHATRAVLAMSPASEQPVVVSIDDAGTGRFASVDADLRAGEITLPGPATAESRTGAALAWSQTATLRLQTDPQGRLTDRLTSADFSGSVTAAQEGGSIQSETLATRFAPGSDNRSALRTAVITNGSMSGEPDATGQPNTLAASAIKVDFAGDAGNPEPVRVQADGTVRAGSAGSTLEADRAVATLARNDAGDTVVRTADASGQVRYTDNAQTSAQADTIRVDGIRETVRLTGPDTSVAQGDSSVTGPIIDLDARARRMSVEGAGRFDHTLRDADNNPAGRVLARWTESMRFDDALGKLACRGDVSVVSTPDASTRDTLSAQRVEVEMTPHPVRDPVGGRGNRERQVTLARAFGGTSGDTPTPATIETRRYDPANPERVTGLLYLESDQIVADAERSLLRVPSAGTLLVLDRRPEADQPQDAPPPADALGGSAGPGLTRFTWQGSMELDRATGIATMDDTVLVRHKTLDPDAAGQAQVAELACDTLTASFRELTGQAPDAAANPNADPAINPAGSFVLDRADALGSVVFRAAGKELLADGARFEAATDTLHALASPGRTVTLIEPGRPTPVSAGAIMWDLRRDRIEINKPSPVTLPN